MILTSAILFLVSFFLPSYLDAPGFICACFSIACLGEVLEHQEWLSDLYVGVFTFSNLFMLLFLPFSKRLYEKTKMRSWIMSCQTLLLLHVLSWPVFCSFDEGVHLIGVGYYVWLASMILAQCASIRALGSRRKA